jgi:hypothetical protein
MTEEEQKQQHRARQLAEGIVGPVQWITDTTGYCTCPGKNLHEPRGYDFPCSVFLVGLHGRPRIYCDYGICSNECDAAVDRLEAALKAAGR